MDWGVVGQIVTAVFVIIGGVGGGWAAFRSKGVEAWKAVAEAANERNKILDKQIETLRSENQAQALELSGVKEKLARLETLPDLSQLLAYLREDRERDDKRFEEVIERLNTRFDTLEGRAVVEHERIIELMTTVKELVEGKGYGRTPRQRKAG
jgi:septal ring factor EnvC (AmiA/AmiB activator)